MDNLQQQPIMMVTGANSGIGKATALLLAKKNVRVVMICRNQQRGEEAQKEIMKESGNPNVELYICDFSRLDNIRHFVDLFHADYERLDVLINNAAVIPQDRQETKDGYEMQFGVNHLAPFLLTNLLLEKLKKSTIARIVTVASVGHKFGKIHFDDLQFTQKPYSKLVVYTQSKLANILFTYELAQRLRETHVTVNCLDPGHVKSDIGVYKDGGLAQFVFRTLLRPIHKTPEDGADTSIYLATSPEVKGITGKYFANRKIKKTSPISYDSDIAMRLWNISSEMVGI
jgi:NAD(P)-dependent dehydrogenase (short-subunit alcohol dehydrogenase family)